MVPSPPNTPNSPSASHASTSIPITKIPPPAIPPQLTPHLGSSSDALVLPHEPPKLPASAATIPGADIFEASLKGDLSTVKQLLETTNFDVNVKNDEGRTCLMDACRGGSLPLVKYLIEQRNALITEKNQNGATVLHVACLGSLEVVKYLISRGANVNERDNNGGHCLLYACDQGRLSIVKYLIEDVHVDANVHDNEGWNGLIFASQDGHLAVIRYLVEEAHANVYHKAVDGTNCLMRAAVDGNLSIVRYLIEEQNCSVEETSNDGQNCLILACLAGNRHIVQYLIIEQGMPVPSFATDAKVPKNVRQFLSKCSDEYMSEQRLKKLQEMRQAAHTRQEPTYFDDAPVFSLQLCVNEKRQPTYADILYALKFILGTENWAVLQRSKWINHIKRCVADYNKQWMNFVKKPEKCPAPSVFSGEIPLIESSDAALWLQSTFRNDVDIQWFVLSHASPRAFEVSRGAYAFLKSKDTNPTKKFVRAMKNERVIEAVYNLTQFDLSSPDSTPHDLDGVPTTVNHTTNTGLTGEQLIAPPPIIPMPSKNTTNNGNGNSKKRERPTETINELNTEKVKRIKLEDK